MQEDDKEEKEERETVKEYDDVENENYYRHWSNRWGEGVSDPLR